MNVMSKNHGMTLIALPNSQFFNSLNVDSHRYLGYSDNASPGEFGVNSYVSV